MTSSADNSTAATAWLREVRHGLASLPGSVRDDILAELDGHIAERVEAGTAPQDVVAALGPADAYARAMYDAHRLETAITTRRYGDMLDALIRTAAGHGLAVLAGAAILVLWAAACLVASVAAFKIADPLHAGLWRSETEFFIGLIDDPSTADELLGVWIFPLTLFALTLAFLATRALAIWTLRRIARRG